MKRKEALRLSNKYCQNVTMFVVALLFVFGATFSAQFVLAQEGDAAPAEVTDETPSEELSEPAEEEPAEEPAPEVIEETQGFVLESDSEDLVIVEEEIVIATSTEETSESQSFIMDLFSLVTIDLEEEVPGARIITPTPNETIYGEYNFTADHTNSEETNPGLRWAIRFNTCSGDTPIVPVFGNVDGATTSPSHTAGAFSNSLVSWQDKVFNGTFDFTGLQQGMYCFAFNPNPKDAFRQTVEFYYEAPGSIVVNKSILGLNEEVLDATEFTIEVDGEEIEGVSDSVVEGDSVVFSGLPAGEYTVQENDQSGYRLVSMTSGTSTVETGPLTVTVTAGATTTVDVVNRFAECNDGINNDEDDTTDTEDDGCINSNDDEEGDAPMCFDEIPPVLTLNGEANVTIEAGSEFVDLGATVTEGESEAVTVYSENEVNVDVPGTYTLHYYTYDDCESRVEITRTVVVEEEDSSGSRSGSRRNTGGSVLGAFTGSNGGSCGMYLNSYMKMGGENNAEEVMKLQAFLNEQGYAVSVNGIFGATTEEAVKAFQRAHAAEILAPWGITDPTGYVFKMTRYVMNNMVCPGSEAMPAL